MIVAELLGVPMDAVNVVQSDTALVPRGMGTMGSRSLQIGGSAIHKTSELVVDKAKRLAAHLLEADVADIVAHEGEGVGAAGAPATALSWAELAMAAGDPARRPRCTTRSSTRCRSSGSATSTCRSRPSACGG